MAAALSLCLGIALAPSILYDDAAISLRYADRMASGRGFTYNDDERVCGTSNPLWTLLIAAGVRAGAAPEQSARALALLSFVAAALLASMVTLALAGPVPALLVALILPADVVWRTQALSGLEVPLGIALGLGAALAVYTRREGLAGVLIGLAIWNKLDAAALLVSAAIAWRLTYGHVPKRLMINALVVPLPWWLFAIAYFGSPWPHSLIAKLHQGRAHPIDPLWIARFFRIDGRYLFCLAAVVCVPIALRGLPQRRAVVLMLTGWLLIHGAAYSVVSLGDEYPWYLAVPSVLAIVLACSSLRARSAVSAIAALAILAAAFVQCRETVFRLTVARPPELFEAFDADRRLAGIFIDQFAGPEEVVRSGFGWVAFESHRPFVDDTGLNSIRTREADYVVAHGVPWNAGAHAPAVPDGYVALATFDSASRFHPGVTWFTVFGRQSSRIARSGRNEESVDVSRLHDDRLGNRWRSRRP